MPVRLKDIARSARVTRNAKASCASTAARRSSWRSTRKATPIPSACANVRKQSIADSGDEAEGCMSILPAGAKLVDDRGSVDLHTRMRSTKCATMRCIGGVLAILIIFFFLSHARSTFIIALSLPVSLIATFFFMGQLRLSLNVMSLGGLALATGMVVDDSIVVLENIARLREKGMGIVEAAVKRRARSVGMAVTASTLTTVAVFFPLVFVQGVAGQLFRDQALTVTFAMLISLVVAMTLIPMLASLTGRSPLAYKDEEQSPGWQPDGRAGKGIKRVVSPVSRLFFYWIPFVLAFVWCACVARCCWLIFTPLSFVGRFAMMPYNAAARAYHAFLPKALAHPCAVLGVRRRRLCRQHCAGADARPRSDPAARARPLRHDRHAAAGHAAGRHGQTRRRDCRSGRERSGRLARSTASPAPARAWMRTRPNRAKTSRASRGAQPRRQQARSKPPRVERLRAAWHRIPTRK